MNTRKTFAKKINRIRKQAAKRPIPTETAGAMDIGSWRITEDDSGSLIIYNFETGSKIVLAQK